MTFFESLNKPGWIPPNWAFPAVWFTLWALQGVALWRISQSHDGARRAAIALLVTQFVASIMWQAVVFGPGRLLLAAWWLTGVLVLVIVTGAVCVRTDRWAGILIAPTIAWVSVATALAWSLYRLNPKA